jgi:hypothetical protein
MRRAQFPLLPLSPPPFCEPFVVSLFLFFCAVCPCPTWGVARRHHEHVCISQGWLGSGPVRFFFCLVGLSWPWVLGPESQRYLRAGPLTASPGTTLREAGPLPPCYSYSHSYRLLCMQCTRYARWLTALMHLCAHLYLLYVVNTW